jgi:hypothetical protein
MQIYSILRHAHRLGIMLRHADPCELLVHEQLMLPSKKTYVWLVNKIDRVPGTLLLSALH